MRFVVATHGHCFDGLASATLFTRLIQETREEPTSFVYRACGYGPDQAKANDGLLDGDENAILDYRYAASSALSWFFDHHPTAFGTPEERGHFDQRQPSGRFFFDPTYSSCTRLVSDISAKTFGVETPALRELVRWADKIDAARFTSAEEAISRDEPVMRLATVVEHHGDDLFLATTIPKLLTKTLLELATSSRIEQAYLPLGQKHTEFIDLIRAKSQLKDGVVLADLTDQTLQSLGKFVTYALFPQSTYSVVVGVVESSAKISVGYNPWSGQPRKADISAICARYGGGGHPFVGGVSLALSDVARARTIALQVAQELGSCV